MAADETIGATVGSYKITAKLGQGGMGAVYLAEHPLLERKAAVKVLLPELSSHKDSVERFFHEARMTARLRHPAMVDVYDFGTLPDGRAYLVMDLLEGESLETRIRTRGALPVPDALRIARDVALGVSVAHAEQIVHRDLKPDNLFLLPAVAGSQEERVKILDFGIAKLGRKTADGAVGVTRVGAVLGTPLFMSPEQCRGAAEVDARADIYSLGCILFAMLAGRPPFVSESMGELLGMQLLAPPPTLESLGVSVPGPVEALVQGLLAKSADDRPPSMVMVAHSLDRLLREESAEPSRGKRTLSLGARGEISTRRGRPTPGLPAPDALTLREETLDGRTISEPGTVSGRARRPLVAVGAALAVVAAVGVVIVAARPGRRATPPLSAGAAPPAVERAAGPTPPATKAAAPAPAPALAPAPAPVQTPAPAPAPAIAAPETLVPTPVAPPRPRKNEARRAGRPPASAGSGRSAAATSAQPAAPPSPPPGSHPDSQEPAANKNARPIYRGTQLQIEKNDPY